jgi:hypothetical protein
VLGKNLPASVISVSGSIVTVKFELKSSFTLPNVTCPLFGPEYIRYPIQAGCKGLVISADAFLGAMSGLGSGDADLTMLANLSAVLFIPCGNKGWSATDDPNALLLYGPNGVVIRTLDSTVKIVVSPTGVAVTLPSGIPLLVNGDIRATGEVTAKYGTPNSVSLTGHFTRGIQPGGATTTVGPQPGS